jgi:hypothetical protein
MSRSAYAVIQAYGVSANTNSEEEDPTRVAAVTEHSSLEVYRRTSTSDSVGLPSIISSIYEKRSLKPSPAAFTKAQNGKN